MKETTEFSDKPKEVSKKANPIYIVVIAVIIGVIFGLMASFYFSPNNPLQQYITERTCNFVSMGDFQTAVCTDGTAWTVSPFQQ